MSVITFSASLRISSMTWGFQRNDADFSSAFFGAQSVGISAPRWMASVESMMDNEVNIGAWKALLMQLNGKVNQLALWDWQRPAPLGTMRGTMTFNGNHSQGATTLSIVASGENSKTLLQGDLIGFGTGTTQQVVMIVSDATSNGSGVISVTIQPPLRNAASTGAAITWDKPCALFRQATNATSWTYHGGSLTEGFMLNLIEDWRT